MSACVRTFFSLFKPIVKGKNVFKKYTILDGQDKNSVKPLFNTDSEGPIESVHINGVSVLSGFQWGLLSPPRTKQTIRNNEVSY